MSLVLAGSRRIFVCLAFCEDLRPRRPRPPMPMLGRVSRRDRDAARPPAPGESVVLARRLHWVVAGRLVGLTLFAIERAASAEGG